MATSPPPAERAAASAAVRRTRYASTTILLVTATTAIALFIAVLGTRFNARFDLTATRAHSLSPRTLSTLERLDTPVEIVVAADRTATDPESEQRGLDLLEAFERASDNIAITIIPTGLSSGARTLDAFDGVTQRVANQQADQVAKHDDALRAYLGDLRAIADQLEALHDPIDTVAQLLPEADNRAEQRSTLASIQQLFALYASQLREGASAAEAEAWLEVAGLRLPQADVAAQAAEGEARPLAQSRQTLVGLQRQVIDPLTGRTPEVADAARALARPTQHALDLIAIAQDRLKRLKPLEPVVVARLFESTEVVLVVSQTGVSAVAVESLFPRSPVPGQPAPDQRAKAEELIATAIGALSDDRRPIAAFVHGNPRRMFEGIGRPTPTAADTIGAIVEKLTLRRIDCMEWATTLDENPPDFSALDPQRKRPIVWIIMPAPSDPQSARGLSDSAFGLARLTDAVELLRSAGESMLFSIEPSRLGMLGEDDPVVESLAPLGITIDSARPILQRIPNPSVPAISAYQFIRNAEPDTPLTPAVSGLATSLFLPMPIRAIEPPPDAVRYTPLLRTTTAAAPNSWAEAQWGALRGASRAAPFQPMALADPPTPDASRDDPDGPWTIAALVERERSQVSRPDAAFSPPTSAPQRAVVVASPEWFDNATLFAGGAIDGRYVTAFPGNAELFENAVYWLAGRDELIGASPRARDIARVEPLTPAQVNAIRWGLIAILPLLVLATGGALRLIRG